MNFFDEDEGPELDFDELNDLVAEIKPKTDLMIITTDNASSNDQPVPINVISTSDTNNLERAELDAAFAGEREDCFDPNEEEQNQPDHELDDTYHTVQKYDASFDLIGQ